MAGGHNLRVHDFQRVPNSRQYRSVKVSQCKRLGVVSAIRLRHMARASFTRTHSAPPKHGNERKLPFGIMTNGPFVLHPCFC